MPEGVGVSEPAGEFEGVRNSIQVAGTLVAMVLGLYAVFREQRRYARAGASAVESALTTAWAFYDFLEEIEGSLRDGLLAPKDADRLLHSGAMKELLAQIEDFKASDFPDFEHALAFSRQRRAVRDVEMRLTAILKKRRAGSCDVSEWRRGGFYLQGGLPTIQVSWVMLSAYGLGAFGRLLAWYKASDAWRRRREADAQTGALSPRPRQGR